MPYGRGVFTSEKSPGADRLRHNIMQVVTIEVILGQIS